MYRNPWLRVREDQVERSNGVHGIYGVVDKHDCAVILPIQGDNIYLIEQFRYTVQQRCLELPQGGWETAGVDPTELARGELREETGLIAASMTPLGTLWIAYGFVHQRQHVYLASGLTPGKADPDPEEHDLVLRTGRFPRLGVPSVAERDLRPWLVQRMKRVRARTTVKNQLHALHYFEWSACPCEGGRENSKCPRRGCSLLGCPVEVVIVLCSKVRRQTLSTSDHRL